MPISLTSVMRKLLEMIWSHEVLVSSPLLDVGQGGFRLRRSPLDQALCLHDLMHNYYLKHHHYPSAVFLYIKSAYKTVDRSVVWRSFQNTANITTPLLDPFMNMFDEAQVSVLISGHLSYPLPVINGLLRISLYINSLPGALKQAAPPTTTHG